MAIKVITNLLPADGNKTYKHEQTQPEPKDGVEGGNIKSSFIAVCSQTEDQTEVEGSAKPRPKQS
jgi:hypothetical protein